MINGNACFAYFNKNWGIPRLIPDDFIRKLSETIFQKDLQRFLSCSRA
jgi:hypothetical protein